MYSVQLPVLQISLGCWKKCLEEVEEKILCSGSGENHENSVDIYIYIYIFIFLFTEFMINESC